MSLHCRQRAGRSHAGPGCVPRPRRVARAQTGVARRVRLWRSPARCRRWRRARCALRARSARHALVREKRYCACTVSFRSRPPPSIPHLVRHHEACRASRRPSTEFGGGRKHPFGYREARRAARRRALDGGGNPARLLSRRSSKAYRGFEIPLSPLALPPRCSTKRGVGTAPRFAWAFAAEHCYVRSPKCGMLVAPDETTIESLRYSVPPGGRCGACYRLLARVEMYHYSGCLRGVFGFVRRRVFGPRS